MTEIEELERAIADNLAAAIQQYTDAISESIRAREFLARAERASQQLDVIAKQIGMMYDRHK